MKLLCTADLHLDAGRDLGARPIGPGSRLDDQERTWRAICQAAIDQQVDAVLFAGDAFHHRRPSPAALMAFQNGLTKLRMSGIPVLAIDGNHDVTSAAEPSAMSVFAAGGAPFRLFRKPCVTHLSNHANTESVAICVLPWTPPHRFEQSGRDPLAEQGLALVEAARGMRAQAEGPAILMAHWSVRGARLPTDLMTDDLREVLLPAAELIEMEWDAVVLGHIHLPQTILAPSMFYCGSPHVVDFGEADSDHGYWIWEDGEASFVELRDRPFRTLDIRLGTGANGASALVDPAFYDDSDIQGAIVRMRVTVDEEEARLVDHAGIRNALQESGAYRVYQVRLEIVRQGRQRADVDEAVEPLEALDRYAEAQHLEPSLKDAMLAKTRSYLQGGS